MLSTIIAERSPLTQPNHPELAEVVSVSAVRPFRSFVPFPASLSRGVESSPMSVVSEFPAVLAVVLASRSPLGNQGWIAPMAIMLLLPVSLESRGVHLLPRCPRAVAIDRPLSRDYSVVKEFLRPVGPRLDRRTPVLVPNLFVSRV